MDKDSQTHRKVSRLRELLATRTLTIPGAFNALVAMQIERAGYEVVYVSGAAISACRGVPDIGLVTLSDMAAEAGRIARSVSIPTIVDADTGYGDFHGPSGDPECGSEGVPVLEGDAGHGLRAGGQNRFRGFQDVVLEVHKKQFRVSSFGLRPLPQIPVFH